MRLNWGCGDGEARHEDNERLGVANLGVTQTQINRKHGREYRDILLYSLVAP
jgi:hypothetical protein